MRTKNADDALSGAAVSGLHGEKGYLEALLSAKGAIVVWLVYVLLMASIQYSLSHTLYTDDAMGSLLIQDFRLGYIVRNPPLWEWTLWAIQQGVGPGFESHLLLRYACIALLGVAVFDAARAVSLDVKWSAAVTLGSPLFYAIGWPYFQSNTYSLAIVIICLFTLSVAIRYVARPSHHLAVLLGFLIGLGLLSKYNYAIFILSLFMASLVLRRSRVALLRRTSITVPIMAVVTVSPFLYWLIAVQADLIDLTRQNLVNSESSHLARSLRGLGRQFELAIGFLLPWGVVAAAAAWRGRYLAREPIGASGFGERLAGLTLLFGISFTTLGIVLMGVTKLNAAYMFPVLVAAVPYSAALLSRAAPGTEGAMPVAMIAVSALGVIILLRLIYLSNSGFPIDSQRRDMWPMADLASKMREAGLDRGTLATVSYREGGNLRAELPELRVVTVGQADSTRASLGTDHAAACRLLWNDTASLFPEAGWARSEESQVVASVPGVAGRARRHFDVPWPPTFLGTQRTSRWTIVELDSGDPVCR